MVAKSPTISQFSNGQQDLAESERVFEAITQQPSKINIKWLLVGSFYILAAFYYHYAERWNVADCVYFLTITISTVGYGDLHPTTNESRLVTILVILVGLAFVFTIISEYASSIIATAEERSWKIISDRSTEWLANLDQYKYAKKYLYAIGRIAFIVFLGSIFLWHNENCSYIEAVYWCIVSTTTVGYGDLPVNKISSRTFLIFYIPISVCLVADALGHLATINMEIAAEEKRIAFLTRKLDFSMIREMDTDGNGVDRCEFLVSMLVQNGICDRCRDIDPWLRRFDELDEDGNGRLDGKDIELLQKEEENRLKEVMSLLAKMKPQAVGINRNSSQLSLNEHQPLCDNSSTASVEIDRDTIPLIRGKKNKK